MRPETATIVTLLFALLGILVVVTVSIKNAILAPKYTSNSEEAGKANTPRDETTENP